MFDGCGLCAAEAPGAFLVTGGNGEVVRVAPRTRGRHRLIVAGAATPWDNHLRPAARSQSMI